MSVIFVGFDILNDWINWLWIWIGFLFPMQKLGTSMEYAPTQYEHYKNLLLIRKPTLYRWAFEFSSNRKEKAWKISVSSKSIRKQVQKRNDSSHCNFPEKSVHKRFSINFPCGFDSLDLEQNSEHFWLKKLTWHGMHVFRTIFPHVQNYSRTFSGKLKRKLNWDTFFFEPDSAAYL